MLLAASYLLELSYWISQMRLEVFSGRQMAFCFHFQSSPSDLSFQFLAIFNLFALVSNPLGSNSQLVLVSLRFFSFFYFHYHESERRSGRVDEQVELWLPFRSLKFDFES
jgi:hypothetical protein